MKGRHKGNRNPYIDQRDHELYRAFCKAKEKMLKERGRISLSDAVDAARKSPASRYFVSEQRASIVLRHIMNNRAPLETMTETKNRLFRHLYVKYKALKSENPEATHEELVVMACASPAQEFYITHKTAIEILSCIHINHKSNGKLVSDRSMMSQRRKPE